MTRPIAAFCAICGCSSLSLRIHFILQNAVSTTQSLRPLPVCQVWCKSGSGPAAMAPAPSKGNPRSQRRSRIMQLGNGSVNRSLQLICCATLAVPRPCLRGQSRFAAGQWVDGFGDTCQRLLLEGNGSSKDLPGKCSSLLLHPCRSEASSTDHHCRLSAKGTTAAFRSNAICQP